jgi:hypothetical protein
MRNARYKMKFVLFFSRKGEKKSPIGPTTPKPMGSREKGGNIMGAICSVLCLCKQSANITDTQGSKVFQERREQLNSLWGFGVRRYSIQRAGFCCGLSQSCIMSGMNQWMLIFERNKKILNLYDNVVAVKSSY